MTTAFVAWRSPLNRKWYPIGRLRSDGDYYEFVYTKGVEDAIREAAFEPLLSFPDFAARFVSEELFPIFANRILSPMRREYPDFVQWLSVPEDRSDPVALIARSGGRRATDALELFQSPERDASGKVRMHFFAHGLQHFSPDSVARVSSLLPGEPLLLMHDFQNPYDPRAMMIRTAEQTPGDIYPVGYCPRYLLEDLYELLHRAPGSVQVHVLRVNPPPAPVWFKLLCTVTAVWPHSYEPFVGDAYRPFSESPRTMLIRGHSGSTKERFRSAKPVV